MALTPGDRQRLGSAATSSHIKPPATRGGPRRPSSRRRPAHPHKPKNGPGGRKNVRAGHAPATSGLPLDEFHVDLGSARTCADTGIFARARSCATSVCPHVRRYGYVRESKVLRYIGLPARAQIRGARIRGARIRGARIRGARIRGARIRSTVNTENCGATAAVGEGVRASRANICSAAGFRGSRIVL